IEPARTDQERCLQGCERKHHLGLAKCAKKLHDCRRSLRGRLDPIYRYRACVSRATLCTGRAYAAFIDCQNRCVDEHLL
ncbi:MAG TPA: hypothetical protein VLH79_14245, partial [Chthonomonadales bacterium]|nr:hypothetical protein [Chthonomonadales bacterium]